MPEGPGLLSAADVTVTRGGATLLSRVSVDVVPGEFLALLGENGAGKSTLIRVLAGEIDPQRGAARMNGRALRAWHPAARARVRAVLPQEHHVTFGFTAIEVALLGRHPHCGGAPGRCDHAIAREALARVGVDGLAHRLVGTLSGGERARVQLARVLAQVWEPSRDGPRYLLLDEPVASLDLFHQHEVMELARALAHDEGLGVAASVHDLNLAGRYADHAVMLKRGEVLAEGPPGQVLQPAAVERGFSVKVRLVPQPDAAPPLLVVDRPPARPEGAP